jgi:hypothetical protein
MQLLKYLIEGFISSVASKYPGKGKWRLFAACVLLLTATHANLASALVPTQVFKVTSPTSISGDGRYITYLVAATSTTGVVVAVEDVTTGAIQQANIGPTGLPASGSAAVPVISNDGRYVVFTSTSPDMGVPTGSNGLFVFDRVNGTVQAAAMGSNANRIYASQYAAISSDGHYVAYRQQASLTDTNLQVYVRDMVAETTQLTAATSTYPVSYLDRMFISDDGRYVSYTGKANATTTLSDVLLYDRVNGTTEEVNVNSAGARETGNSSLTRAFSMSSDGMLLAFVSNATNLSFAGDVVSHADIFLRDRTAGTTVKLSHSPANGASGTAGGTSISADGRYVTFIGYGTTTTVSGLYRLDRLTNTAVLAGFPTVTGASCSATTPVISGAGRYVLYYCPATYTAVADFGPPAGITLSGAPTTLVEGGAVGTYTVALNVAPTAEVDVAIAPGTQFNVSNSTLAFTSANWSTPQTIIVRALQDGVTEGPHTGTIVHTVSSTDPQYKVVPATNLNITITDAVTPTIVLPASTWTQTSLPLTGVAGPGTTLLLTATNLTTGLVSSVSAAVNSSGAWSLTLTGLSSGNYQLQAEADAIQSSVYSITVTLPAPGIGFALPVALYNPALLDTSFTTKTYSGNF